MEEEGEDGYLMSNSVEEHFTNQRLININSFVSFWYLCAHFWNTMSHKMLRIIIT